MQYDSSQKNKIKYYSMYLPEHYLLDVVGSQCRKKISHNLKEHKKNIQK